MAESKKHSFDELLQFYNLAQEADNEVMAEQRSNVMLIAGNHYAGKGTKHWNRIRDIRDIPGDMKIRLTKNHIQRITKTFHNQIVSAAPGVQVVPRNEKEIQDQKCAQLNQSVWQFACDQLKMPMKVMSLAKDFIDIGEAAVKIFWNPFAGKFLGYNQKVDEMGQPMVDETGQLVADEQSPQFEGELQIEKILATNLLRDHAATSMEESPWLCVRKMVPVEDMKKMVGNDPEKMKLIQESQRDAYMVFDTNASNYMLAKGQCLLMEFYFRPCQVYPNGYYFIMTKQGIIFEGELPYGIFPIEYVGFDESQSSPRHRSIVKQLRPYQMEINRTASKIAEHQTTSDDKILIQSGTKIASGGILPGVRAIQYSGSAPTILEGRAGAQYVDYMAGQITEMYQVAGIMEDVEQDKQTADPYGLLFRSVKQQKKFTIYISKFEDFLKRMTTTYLRLAKPYLPDDVLIPMIGKAEFVNIQEFRSSEDVRTQIKVMPMSEDINSMFGKWLAINHAIQYVGSQMGKEDIGKLMRQMPYGNFEESFDDFTMDYDLANNYILALERGQWMNPSSADNKSYMIKRLEKRMRGSDFGMLNPQIQQMFAQAKDMYEQMEVEEKLAIQRAEQGFIPTGGALIKCDMNVQVPNSAGGVKTERASFPVESLMWLQKQLEVQGSNFKDLSEMPQATQAEISQKFIPQSNVFYQENKNTGGIENQQKPGANQMPQGGMSGNGQPSQFQ